MKFVIAKYKKTMDNLFNEQGQSTPIEKDLIVLPESQAETTETVVAETPTETVAATPETTEIKKEETTEVKAEEKTAETEEKPKSLFEQFKKPASEATPAAEEKPVVADDKRVAELEERLKQYDTPLAKLLGGDYDLTKVDVAALLKSAVGEDYSGYSTEDLIAKSLNADPDFLQLTPEEQKEEIENRVANLSGMSKYEIQKERSKILSTLNKGGDISELVKGLEEVKKNQLNSIQEPEKWYAEKVTEEYTNLRESAKIQVSELANQLVGQEYEGYVVTEADAKDIVSVFEDQTAPQFSGEKSTLNAFKIATYERAVADAKKRGYEEAMLEKANPSTNSSSAPVIVTKDPTAMGTATKEDFFTQANS